MTQEKIIQASSAQKKWYVRVVLNKKAAKAFKSRLFDTRLEAEVAGMGLVEEPGSPRLDWLRVHDVLIGQTSEEEIKGTVWASQE
jgi:hypothetical protein